MANINRKGAIQYVFKEKEVRRMRIPRNADKGSDLHGGRTAFVRGGFNEEADAL